MTPVPDYSVIDYRTVDVAPLFIVCVLLIILFVIFLRNQWWKMVGKLVGKDNSSGGD